MPAIFLVFVLGTAINVANTQPHSFSDVQEALLNQVKHPVISAADHYNK